MLIDGVVVDYRQTTSLFTPRIQAFATESITVEKYYHYFLRKGIDQETKRSHHTFFFPDDTLSGLAKLPDYSEYNRPCSIKINNGLGHSIPSNRGRPGNQYRTGHQQPGGGKSYTQPKGYHTCC
jgi:hypothetical protein